MHTADPPIQTFGACLKISTLRGEEVSSIMIEWRATVEVRAERGGRLNTPLTDRATSLWLKLYCRCS
jgi:hypothetical protein